MNQLNSVLIEGNATRDAEIKYSNNGAPICKMSAAVNRRYKSGDGFEKEVSFFDVDAFSEVAKLCGEKVKKGDEVRITGRLKQSRWIQDGQNRSAVLVVAERVEFNSRAKGGQHPAHNAAQADEDISFPSGFNTPPLWGVNTGGVGDLFPHKRNAFKVKSSIPRGSAAGIFYFKEQNDGDNDTAAIFSG